MTGSFNAPKAAGDPVGSWTPDNVHHVAYRSADKHMHELWWQGQGPVGHNDLTALAGAIPAAGDPSAYFDPVRGTNIVAFRDIDGRIRSVYWSGGPVGQDDLSGYAQMPNAAGDPWAYFSPADDMHHVTYRATDGHVIELVWPNVAPVSGRNLTATAGAPTAASDPVAAFNPAAGGKHVFYRSADGRLHELFWHLGDAAVAHADLNETYGAPLAADRPTFFLGLRGPVQHVAYRAANGHINEILW
jgi:hypothetical protein